VHSWLRRQLWWWALLLAVSVLLGWILGDWHTAWRILQTVVLVLTGLGLAYLIVAGFIELRSRKKDE
jgi:hypothetical protein